MEIRRLFGLPGRSAVPWPVELIEFDLCARGLLRPPVGEAGGVDDVAAGPSSLDYRDAVGAELPGEVLALRPLRRSDEGQWHRLRWENRDWLAPWEPTPPPGQRAISQSFQSWRRELARQARRGENFTFAIELDGALVGQISVGAVQWGAGLSTPLGYWVDQAVAGRGVMPLAVAMSIDFLLLHGGLHRVEINIRPENAPSLRVPAKLGLRYEGERRGFLHIDGAWADHRSFAITAEELDEGGLVGRLEAAARHRSGPRL
ncbi:GNAT family N-acetyltransferase [Buchananella felis]|uniref:GNAT family N-acetyltransferase n=1 Tax=Buchananella felis TaxID=3231492 RepID=UPI003527C7F4